VLNLDAMQEAGGYLLGEHDFSALRGSHCQAKSPVKTIEFITITKQDYNILIDIKAK
jgi:tRNA pseudouridine38-40 synthase